MSQISQAGGLGDVVQSLPLAMHALGIEIRVVIPFTTHIDLKKYECKQVHQFSFPMAGFGEEVAVWRTDYFKNVPVFLLENKNFFHSNKMYGDFYGFNQPARYCFFSNAVIELIRGWDFVPDVIHAHDFFTSIIALYRNTVYKNDPVISKIGTLLTVHNIRSQGKTNRSILDYAGIDHKELNGYAADALGEVSLIGLGILQNDIVNTVSPTYAKEVRTAEFGYGVEKMVRKRRRDFYGILNGIDIAKFDPRRTDQLYHPYRLGNVMRIKPKNKRKLLEKLGLRDRLAQPLVSMVTRLDEQKGMDLVFAALPYMVELDWTFVFLGQGRLDYVKKLKELVKQYPHNVRAKFVFDSGLGKLIYAGSDLFLMPSKFEPCGLGDMMAMRYGTPPIVRLVGGLKDAVKDGYNGFGFVKYSVEGLLSALNRADEAYRHYQEMKKSGRRVVSKWELMIKHAMRKDVSWKKSARQYRTLYNKVLKKNI